MKITFVLPGDSRAPGTDKVVFEYANHLAFRGHSVTVVHPASVDATGSAAERVFQTARFRLWEATGDFGPQSWFHLWPTVQLAWVPSLDEKHIPEGDVIVATAWPTAGAVTTYRPEKGCKFYLLRNYQPLDAPEDLVRTTWMLPLQKIAIARWLKETAEEMGESAAYIPNGLDFEAFGCDIPIRQRTSPTVTMPYHENIWKGSRDGIHALRLVQKVVPDLKVKLFGIDSKPKGLPGWMTYLREPKQADLRNLYNESTVFLAPSWKEGWPLPPAEAMSCGAALVCTSIPGHDEYAVENRNAFLAQPRDPQSLAEALVRALKEKSTRFAYAEQGLSDIRRFTWDAATDRLETEFSWRVADAAAGK